MLNMEGYFEKCNFFTFKWDFKVYYTHTHTHTQNRSSQKVN